MAAKEVALVGVQLSGLDQADREVVGKVLPNLPASSEAKKCYFRTLLTEFIPLNY